MNKLLITLLPVYKYSMFYGNMSLTVMTMFPRKIVIEGELTHNRNIVPLGGFGSSRGHNHVQIHCDQWKSRR